MKLNHDKFNIRVKYSLDMVMGQISVRKLSRWIGSAYVMLIRLAMTDDGPIKAINKEGLVGF